jgi:hypothetical protein
VIGDIEGWYNSYDALFLLLLELFFGLIILAFFRVGLLRERLRARTTLRAGTLGRRLGTLVLQVRGCKHKLRLRSFRKFRGCDYLPA